MDLVLNLEAIQDVEICVYRNKQYDMQYIIFKLNDGTSFAARWDGNSCTVSSAIYLPLLRKGETDELARQKDLHRQIASLYRNRLPPPSISFQRVSFNEFV